MIAVDTNILVYSHREDSAFHSLALAAVTALAESGNLWAVPWPSIHEFLAISSIRLRRHESPVPRFMMPALRPCALLTASTSCGLPTGISPASPG
jgi:predicted nucleic acid-binding protein